MIDNFLTANPAKLTQHSQEKAVICSQKQKQRIKKELLLLIVTDSVY